MVSVGGTESGERRNLQGGVIPYFVSPSPHPEPSCRTENRGTPLRRDGGTSDLDRGISFPLLFYLPQCGIDLLGIVLRAKKQDSIQFRAREMS